MTFNYAALLLSNIFPVALIVAAVNDIRRMTIPNILCLGLGLAYIPAAMANGLSLSLILQGLSMGVAGLMVGFLLFALRLFGGGDAKLIAAACLWLGPKAMAPFLFYTAICGGVLTLVLLELRVGYYYLKAKYPNLNAPEWAQHILKPKGDIPYGVAICLGGLLSLSYSPFSFHLG